MIDEAPLSVPAVAIFRQDTGALVLIGPKGTEPWAGQSWIPLPTGYLPDSFEWDPITKMMGESAAKVEATLVAAVKSLAANKKLTAMSSEATKTEEYRLKAPEIAASANVAANVLNALSGASAMAQYPAAAMEAKLTGEPLATVLARFRNGAATSDPEVRRLSAIEHTGTARIKAAATPSLKRAAYKAINWNWTA